MHFDVVSGSPGKKYLLGGVSHPHGRLLRLVGFMGKYTKRISQNNCPGERKPQVYEAHLGERLQTRKTILVL